MTADRFPGIKRAALAIAYDNGGINRARSQNQMLLEFQRWLDRQAQEPLPEIDAWLSSLSEDDLETVCAGEHNEMMALMSGAPPFTEKLLNDYFEGPC